MSTFFLQIFDVDDKKNIYVVQENLSKLSELSYIVLDMTSTNDILMQVNNLQSQKDFKYFKNKKSLTETDFLKEVLNLLDQEAEVVLLKPFDIINNVNSELNNKETNFIPRANYSTTSKMSNGHILQIKIKKLLDLIKDGRLKSLQSEYLYAFFNFPPAHRLQEIECYDQKKFLKTENQKLNQNKEVTQFILNQKTKSEKSIFRKILSVLGFYKFLFTGKV